MANKSPDSPDPIRRKILAAAAVASSQLILPSLGNANPKPSTVAKRAKMDLDHFVQDCVDANKENDPQAAVLEVLARAVHDPAEMLTAVGEPVRAGISIILRSETLTIFNASWTPQMNLMPHNHLMWANIGIYTGREDNLLWRETEDNI